MKILLVGNPNVGKTTLFNALTGAHNRTGNYHGVTVGVSERTAKEAGLGTVCDLPGIYSLNGKSMEEVHAGKYIDAQKSKGALIIQVIDAEHLRRGLRLTDSLIKTGLPVVLALTMCDRHRKRGGELDCNRLARSIGLPCLEVDALSKKSVADFSERLSEFACRKSLHGSSGYIPEGVLDGYKTAVCKSRITEKCLNGYVALPLFFAFATLIFYITFADGMLGVFLKERLERVISFLSERIKRDMRSPILKTLICDGLISGVGSVLSFIPQIALIYLFLDLLEESGFMSVLAYATDGLFSLIGLSGRAAFSVLLGYGCTAAAIASTRALDDKRAQRRSVVCLYFIPCSAKLPVYITLLSCVFSNSFWGAVLLYVLGTGLGLTAAAYLKEEEEPFIMEIADIFPPNVFSLLKKLLFQLKQFIIKVSTVVFVFTFLVQLLATFSFSGVCTVEESILAQACSVLKYAFYPMGINDWRAAFAAVSGLIAKENIAGMLSSFFPDGLHFTLPAAFAYLTFIVLLPPCVSAITACAGELGKRRAWGYALMQTAFAFLCAYAVYGILALGAGIIFIVATAFGGTWLIIAFIKKKRQKRHERIYRGKGRKFKRVYR